VYDKSLTDIRKELDNKLPGDLLVPDKFCIGK
jgi:hypothetical protein